MRESTCARMSRVGYSWYDHSLLPHEYAPDGSYMYVFVCLGMIPMVGCWWLGSWFSMFVFSFAFLVLR